MKRLEALLELVAGLEGVITVAHQLSLKGEVKSGGAPNFTPIDLARIMKTGFGLFEEMEKDFSECQELRLDMEEVQLLYHFSEENGLFAIFVEEGQDLDTISAGVQGLSQMSPAWLRQTAKKPAKVAEEPKEAKKTAPVRSSRYVDEELIGEGGTAKVYRAYDTILKREVALKRYNDSDEEKADYDSELQSASLISHHNVVSTFDAGQDERSRFMVMELIDGKDLQLLIENNPLPVEKFGAIAKQALEGISATHNSGLLHLDVKPSNIMLAQESNGGENLKIIDYGRAQAVPRRVSDAAPRGSGLSGSIYFTSPESLKEEPLDQRTDLYSMGCVFYWVLTGKRPFEGPDSLGVMAAHLQHMVTDLSEIAPHIPRRLSTWVMSLIKEDRNLRPSSAEEALVNLARRGFA